MGQTWAGGWGKNILSFFLGPVIIWHSSRKKLEAWISSFLGFSAVDYHADETKTSSANVFSKGNLSISRDPDKSQEEGFKPTKSIIKKHSQRNWKGVIQRQTNMHKYKGDSWTFPQISNIMKQLMSRSWVTICQLQSGTWLQRHESASVDRQWPMLN